MGASEIAMLLKKDDTADCMPIHPGWEVESEAHLQELKFVAPKAELKADMIAAEGLEVKQHRAWAMSRDSSSLCSRFP
jgi:hypothetical protein